MRFHVDRVRVGDGTSLLVTCVRPTPITFPRENTGLGLHASKVHQ